MGLTDPSKKTHKTGQTTKAPALKRNKKIDASKALNIFLKKHKAERGGPHTHTRIPDTNTPEYSNIWGGSYNIPDSDLPEFNELLAKKIWGDGKKEYLTECQLHNAGPILVDLDFRYKSEITTRQHDSCFIDEVVATYFENLQKLFEMPEDQEIPCYIFEKPDVNILEDKTKDGIHLMFGIKATYQEQLLLREEVLKSFGELSEALPLTNKNTDVIDPCIPKGKTNWQMYGSRKPFHEAYELVCAYNIGLDEFGDIELSEILDILDKLPKNELLFKLSARNPNHNVLKPTAYNLASVTKYGAQKKKKKNKKKIETQKKKKKN